MTDRTKTAAQLKPGHVVTAYPDPDHPDRYGQPGRWTIAEPDPRHERYVGDRIRIEYDGGMWALHPDQPVIVQPTAREHQQAACAALTRLLALDLPALRWHITPWPNGVVLEGQVPSFDADVDRLAALHEWAAHLRVPVVSHTYEDHASHEFGTTCDGVELRVWAQTAVTYTYVKASQNGDAR